MCQNIYSRYPERTLEIPSFVSEAILRSTWKKNKSRISHYSIDKNVGEKERAWLTENGVSVRMVFYFLKRNLNTITFFRCRNCGKELTEKQIVSDKRYCSLKCSNSDTEVQEKKKETYLRKYGVENPSFSEDVLKKIKTTKFIRYGDENYVNSDKNRQTCMERYGVEYYTKTDEYKERYKVTCLEKYGVDNTFKSEFIKNKIKETNLLKYGTEYYSSTDECKEKVKTTNLERYGVDCSLKRDDIKEKVKQTSLRKYGVEYTFQSKEVREKTVATNLERYGVEYGLANAEIREKIKVTKRRKYFDKFVKFLGAKDIELLSSKEDYIDGKQITLKCKKCGKIWTQEISHTIRIYCHNCSVKPYSNKECELDDYVKSIYQGEIIENDRKVLGRKELDIYLPDKHLAIEFNGNYWHSDEIKGKSYHQDKSLMCKERGIRLVHIFEYEWDTKRDKIKNLIKSSLGIFDKTLYARNCTVKPISSKEYKDFLDENHLSGSVNSPNRFGLFHDDELVSVVGFGKSRFKKDERELHRYCVKSGYRVIGGFSKLVKHSNEKDFVTYVDFTHFSGEGYKKLGFEEICLTSPNYVYVKNSELRTRYECQKHKLKALLKEKYDESLSETENMEISGFNKIYDSGNVKLRKIP